MNYAHGMRIPAIECGFAVPLNEGQKTGEGNPTPQPNDWPTVSTRIAITAAFLCHGVAEPTG